MAETRRNARSFAVISLDAREMAVAARDFLALAVLLAQQDGGLEALAASAEAAEVPRAASTIRRAAPLVKQVRGVFETNGLLLRERSRWAAIAAEDKTVAAFIDRIMKTRDGVLFLFAAAKGGSRGIQLLSVNWRLTASYSSATVMADVAILRRLAIVAQSNEYSKWAKIIDETYVYRLDKAYLSSFTKEARLALQLTPDSARWKALGRVIARIERAEKFESDLRYGARGEAALVGLATLLEYWQNHDNPYMTDERKNERLVATAGAGLTILGVSALLSLACGPGAPGCLAVVAGGSVAAGWASGVAIDRHLPENQTISFTKYRELVERARREDFDDFVEKHLLTRQYIDQAEAKEIADERADPGTERWRRIMRDEVEQRQRAERKRAEDEFYRRNVYPPSDPVDELMLKENDRHHWSVRMAEISLKN